MVPTIYSLDLPVETQGVQGEKWKATCQNCHLQYGDCCRDLEMTLFPDEIINFQKHDPNNVTHYTIEKKISVNQKKKIAIWGYNAKRCIFLTEKNLCRLQEEGQQKPVDCLIYPMNYKNNKIFLDTSCMAKGLIDINQAKVILGKKLQKYPDYYMVRYEEMPSDQELGDIP